MPVGCVTVASMKGTDVGRAATSNNSRPASKSAGPAITQVESPNLPGASGEEGKPATSVALLTVKQAAERLNVGAGTVYALCAGRKLEHVRVGAGRGTLRIEEQALQRFVQGATVRSKEATAPQPSTARPKHPAITLKNLSLS